MNKKKFVKLLKSKLSILEESEIADIIEEYSDIIEEKIKNGKTEEEAIADFGDIDELAKEILKAYKVNPKFAEKEESDLGKDFESFVKKGANKLTDFTKNVAEEIKKDGHNISIEFIFEIIIKVIVLLIILAVLRLPFMFISYLGESILGAVFFPIDAILSFIWNFIVWILYIISCVLVGIAMFKDNIRVEENPKKKESKKKEDKEKSEKTEKKEIESIVSNETSKESHLGNNLVKILIMITKLFVFLILIFPLWCIICGICLAIILLIYYLIIGINCWGILLIAIGCLSFFAHANHVIYNIMKGKKNYYAIPLLISVLFVGVGSLLTFNTIRNFDYEVYQEEKNIEKFVYTIDKNTNVYLDDKYEVVIDNSLEDGQIIIQASYYEEYKNIIDRTNANAIRITSSMNRKDRFWKLYDQVIEDLKNYHFVDYSDIDTVHYKIKANTNTVNKLRIVD